MPSFLFVCRKPPYGDSLPREALDMALATAAFDQQVSLFFTGDGVWQLLQGQDGQRADQKDIAALISAMPLYDIEALYADSSSLRDRGLRLEQLLPGVHLLEPSAYATLAAESDVVLNF